MDLLPRQIDDERDEIGIVFVVPIDQRDLIANMPRLATWLPLWRICSKPKRLRACMACVPEILGSLGTLWDIKNRD
jgi:hypothetical protein